MDLRYKNFYRLLNEMDEKEHFEKFMLFLLAPVIAGFKPSSTITLVKSSSDFKLWKEYGEEFLNTLNLNKITLRSSERADIVLIYNKENLKIYIECNNSKIFLNKLGYELDSGLESILEKLKTRYSIYHCPHELGIFLGIPLKDVIDFMECTEKKCLLCGYWKVFNDFDKAVEIFSNYDNSKDSMVDYILKEYNTEKIISLFKKNQYIEENKGAM